MKDGVALRIRVTPRARRAGSGGIIALPDGPAVRVTVTAPPSDGAATAAVLKLLARIWDIPGSALAIAAGATGRSKTVTVTGDPALLAARLETWLTRTEEVSA
ncbi:MAG: DUF167 domain-containing protein [Alphaproteobacteria bacterium]|nr:DUF167 domain-containing protein [Alphaproteobacteria bacterium]